MIGIENEGDIPIDTQQSKTKGALTAVSTLSLADRDITVLSSVHLDSNMSNTVQG